MSEICGVEEDGGGLKGSERGGEASCWPSKSYQPAQLREQRERLASFTIRTTSFFFLLPSLICWFALKNIYLFGSMNKNKHFMQMCQWSSRICNSCEMSNVSVSNENKMQQLQIAKADVQTEVPPSEWCLPSASFPTTTKKTSHHKMYIGFCII